jgi:uncharacterized protein (DUF433 family)
LAETTLELLDQRAGECGETSNRLAEQLISKRLRTRSHPFVSFRAGFAGGRRPALTGSRLYVWQVIETVRASGGGSAEEATDYLGLSADQVRACVSYYADFQGEGDAYAEEERELARREEVRCRREQKILG